MNIKCNQCGSPKSDKVQLHLGSCYDIICNRCKAKAKTGCPVCHTDGIKFVEINAKMPNKMKDFFRDPEEILKNTHSNLTHQFQVFKFHQRQMKLLSKAPDADSIAKAHERQLKQLKESAMNKINSIKHVAKKALEQANDIRTERDQLKKKNMELMGEIGRLQRQLVRASPANRSKYHRSPSSQLATRLSNDIEKRMRAGGSVTTTSHETEEDETVKMADQETSIKRSRSIAYDPNSIAAKSSICENRGGAEHFLSLHDDAVPIPIASSTPIQDELDLPPSHDQLLPVTSPDFLQSLNNSLKTPVKRNNLDYKHTRGSTRSSNSNLSVSSTKAGGRLSKRLGLSPDRLFQGRGSVRSNERIQRSSGSSRHHAVVGLD